MEKVSPRVDFQGEALRQLPALLSSKARCACQTAAVSTQRPWRAITSLLIYPEQSSRRKERCHRPHSDRQEEEEEEEEGSSGGEEVTFACNDVPFSINERLRCIGFNERRPSFSDTESVSDFITMPVGTTNSILKSSFSLTSLRSATPTDSPEHAAQLGLKTERPYHSLTKKSRKSSEQDKEVWRKSWGSGISQDGKEFWEGFQADYDYLMAQNILDRDLPAGGASGATPTAPLGWSPSEFMDHFAQLYSWLRGIQDSVYGKQENVTDWKLRAERQEDMQRQRFRLENFNEESKKLTVRCPEMESEILWRMKHVNDKWETVEALMGGCRRRDGEAAGRRDSRHNVDHELKCLRKWLRELDSRLQPLSFHRGWTNAELDTKTKEHQVLHRDIEGHRKIVSSLLKLCEKSDPPGLLLAARALERKYHEYYLRSLEWQCHIESLAALQLNKSSSVLSNDSDGEPVAKIPRFACGPREKHEKEDEDGSRALNSDDESFEGDEWSMDTSVESKGADPSEMVAERPDESISGIEDSSTKLGPKSKDGSSLANPAAKSTPKPAAGLLRTNQGRDGVDGKDFGGANTAAEPETNRCKGKPPNTGTFTWTHLDTDSEQEKGMTSEGEAKGKKVPEGKDAETTSSEDGWTYVCGTSTEAGVQKKPKAAVRLEFKEGNAPKEAEKGKHIKYFSAKNIPRPESAKMPGGKEAISSSNRKLVDLADELVRCKSKPWKSRKTRARKGEDSRPPDSCDASGEYTTTEESEECESSEDNDGSVATFVGRRSGSAEGILDESPAVKAPFEYVLRSNRHALRAMRNRPWSMSSVSWLRTPRGQSLKARSSMSESALNQMMEQCERDKSKEFCSSPGRGNRVGGGEDGSGGSSRKKRTKIRKRTNKKTDSGSDALTLSGSDSADRSSPNKQISGLVKSGSFSGVSRKQREFSSKYDVTGTETEEERTVLIPPVFRLGPKGGAVTVSVPEAEKGQGEEQLSLNWDNYQEKYQSEAYSEEPPDSDTAKKLLEFGEDYGKFLGTLSDCPSSRGRSASGRGTGKADSDSDVDEVRKALRQSQSQLTLWEMKFNKTVGGLNANCDFTSDEFVSKTLFDEIIGACRRNIDCLTKMLEEVKDETLLVQEHKSIQNVKESWETLKATAEVHKAKQLRKDMTVLKDELLNLAASVDSMETSVISREELEAKITRVQNELNLMKKGKCKLLQANVSVHRFLSTAKNAEPSLKDEVAELYQVWDQTFCRVSSHLFDLQGLSQTWHDFEDHLAQLQCALRTDTLKVLDFALKCGKPSADVPFSLQDIAGLLSDKDSEPKESMAMMEASSVGKSGGAGLVALGTEGSLSDSGISDSGSEQELSEREKRLAQLKRLAKRLEGILAPGSQALSNMFKRIEQAETELRELQKTCRDLIVRSASGEELKAMVAKGSGLSGLEEALKKSEAAPRSGSGKKERNRSVRRAVAELVEEAAAGEDADDGKPGKKSWLWRLLRFALPFQLALVALLCVACLMEPRCCDSLNNLDMSLGPRLRYDSGPPPVPPPPRTNRNPHSKPYRPSKWKT